MGATLDVLSFAKDHLTTPLSKFRGDPWVVETIQLQYDNETQEVHILRSKWTRREFARIRSHDPNPIDRMVDLGSGCNHHYKTYVPKWERRLWAALHWAIVGFDYSKPFLLGWAMWTLVTRALEAG